MRKSLQLIALLVLMALPACSKGAEETKTGHEPKAVHAFLPVDDRAVRMAKAELARRTFLLGKGEKERQQAYEMLKLLETCRAVSG